MLKINNKSILSVYDKTTGIEKIMKGTLKVYEAFRKLIASGVSPITLQKCKGVDLVDYKIYGNSVQKLLPSEYQEVEYIESTGEQYINTGFMPNQDSSVEIYGHQIYNQTNSLFGVNPYFVITSGSGFYRFRYNNTAIDTTITSNTLVKIALKKNEAYINDELIGTFEVGEFQTTYNALLFGRVSSSGSAEETKASRIYYAKIWDNDVLVRHFIPCYRKSDNVIGMYDIINKTFYGNVGTENFLKGKDTSSLPTPDTPIEVESVGEIGKNLFNEKLLLTHSKVTKTENGYSNSGYPSVYYRDEGIELVNHLKSVIKPNTTYTLSRYVSNYIKSSSGAIMIRSSSESLVSVPLGNGLKSVTFSLTQEQIDNITQVYIYGWNSDPTIFEYIQLEEGTSATEYEPYRYSIPVRVTDELGNETITNIYLDEPLRKIGDYADYIDFEKRKVIRNIKRVYANNKISYRYDMANGAVFNGEWAVFQFNIAFKDVNIAYSNKFKRHSSYAKADYVFWLQKAGTYISFNLKKTDIGATSENTNAEIQTLGINYVAKNQIYFDIVVEPTPETIELPNIPTFKGTTIIEVDTNILPSNMEVKYYGKE